MYVNMYIHVYGTTVQSSSSGDFNLALFLSISYTCTCCSSVYTTCCSSHVVPHMLFLCLHTLFPTYCSSGYTTCCSPHVVPHMLFLWLHYMLFPTCCSPHVVPHMLFLWLQDKIRQLETNIVTILEHISQVWDRVRGSGAHQSGMGSGSGVLEHISQVWDQGQGFWSTSVRYGTGSGVLEHISQVWDQGQGFWSTSVRYGFRVRGSGAHQSGMGSGSGVEKPT